MGSEGQNELRVYATMDVPVSRPDPAMETERVLLVDPRDARTAPSSASPANTGPRNAEQAVWPPPPPPAIDLPDGLPATKAQRIHIDPELIARWREEAKLKEVG